ncbi:pentatricopeptide repeat-containing protein At4g02750-like [Mangifera indica]|uniref:pentatricopeptide repeat-containing protein At4g02750-like n=1 Tax=Mangifera indica TaxID=29780 RepID=UPI001CF979A6|nr:pentatricopeptide repeat-containing protein At4g02750-like [Mangifera indica]
MKSFLRLNDQSGVLRINDEKMLTKCSEHNLYSYQFLVKICAKVGSLREVSEELWDGRKVFDQGSMWNLVSWNLMIDGHVKNGDLDCARELFDFLPNKDIFTFAYKSLCGYRGYGDGKMVVAMMPFRDVVSWNCIIDGFAKIENVTLARGCFDRMATRNAKFGDMDLATNVFNEMPTKREKLWIVMIMGYDMHGQGEKALEMFMKMEKRGPTPNDAIFLLVHMEE